MSSSTVQFREFRPEYRNTGTHLEKFYVCDDGSIKVLYSLPLTDVRYMTQTEFLFATTLAEVKAFHGDAIESIEIDPMSTSQYIKATIKRTLPVEFVNITYTVKIDT